MNDIDWSTAPDGTTHWEPAYSANVCPAFVRQVDGWSGWEWFNTLTGSWQGHAGMSDARKSTLIPHPLLPWDGEGKPPVGVRCEAAIPHTVGPNNEHSIIWIEGSVIAYCEIKGNTYAWFAEDDGFYPPCVLEFRPIRTPEQIAAEGSKESIYKIALIMCRDGAFDLEDPEVKVAAELIYDAGYRKQEQPK